MTGIGAPRAAEIAWYVHHHGSGHRHRAESIGAALTRRGASVRFFSSLPPLDDRTWTQLRPDADAPVDIESASAGRVLHWAPLRHEGLLQRTSEFSHALATRRPDLVVVDASVEITLLARLHGVPVVVMAAPGDRRDEPHALAYRVAERLIAPWPPWATPLIGPEQSAALVAVGAFSRYDTRPAAPPEDRRVVVLLGAGGHDAPAGWFEAAQRHTPGWSWELLIDVADPWPALSGAHVVVCHAGQNAVAEVAHARRPAIVIAQDRPFGEQHATARVLGEAGIAVGLDGWPEPADWPELLRSACETGGLGWSRWSDGGGADRAAQALLDVIR